MFLCDSSDDKLLRDNLLNLVNSELENLFEYGFKKISNDKLIIHYVHPEDKIMRLI